MKVYVLMGCLVFTGVIRAQEEKHLEGTLTGTESINAIEEVSQKRVELDLEVLAYPNPTNGKLFVEGLSGSTVTIYSVAGIYVGTWVIGEERKVEINDLTTGTYVCKVLNGTDQVIRKIVVL